MARPRIIEGRPEEGDTHGPDYDPPERITQLHSWLIGQLAAAGTAVVSEAIAPENLRRQHYVILAALAERGAASQAALGRRLSIDRSDMHALLGDLERSGLIARVRDENDRRRVLVDLTPAGARALKRIERRVDAAQEALLAPLSAAERDELHRLLTRLVDYHSGVQPT